MRTVGRIVVHRNNKTVEATVYGESFDVKSRQEAESSLDTEQAWRIVADLPILIREEEMTNWKALLAMEEAFSEVTLPVLMRGSPLMRSLPGAVMHLREYTKHH